MVKVPNGSKFEFLLVHKYLLECKKSAKNKKDCNTLFQHELWNQVQSVVGDASCCTNNAVQRYNRTMKSLLGVNANLWITMQLLVSQEAETRVILMSNAAGLDLTVNQGRIQQQKDSTFRLKSIVMRCADLTPLMYMQCCLAKHLNNGS